MYYHFKNPVSCCCGVKYCLKKTNKMWFELKQNLFEKRAAFYMKNIKVSL